MDDKKICISGGMGAIGSALVEKLLEKKEQVVVIDDLSSGHDCLGDLKDEIEFYHTSVLNDDMLDKIFGDHEIKTVYHLAALFANQKSVDQPREDLSVNGMGTLKLLQYAQKHHVNKFIFTSSSCVYGNSGFENREDELQQYNLDTPYAITKLLGEKYCQYFHDYYGINTVVLRLFNCYGPRERPGKYRNVIPNFFKSALNKQLLTVYGTGKETRSYCYVEDTVRGLIRASECSEAVGQVINIGNNTETTSMELAEKINSLCGNVGDKKIMLFPQRGWDNIQRRKANIDKAAKILNWKPTVGLDEGLRKTYDWMVNNDEIWKK